MKLENVPSTKQSFTSKGYMLEISLKMSIISVEEEIWDIKKRNYVTIAILV